MPVLFLYVLLCLSMSCCFIRHTIGDIPLTGKSFTVSYDGTVKAGIKDLRQATVEAPDEKAIVVTLSAVEITAKELDQDSLEVIDDSRNIFNQNSIADFNQAQKEEEEDMEQRAVERGIVDRANAKAVIGGMLKSPANAYDLVIRWQE